LVIAAFCSSVMWIFIIADEILDALAALGIIWGISETILAITVLAWGNSVFTKFIKTLTDR
jgi:solute carrier family 24 (sodium/potassium/calcium exchanger), member 6